MTPRAWLIVLAACGGGEASAPHALPPAAASCTRTLASEPLRPQAPSVARVAWLPGDQLAVLVGDGHLAHGELSTDREGLAIYDASHPAAEGAPPLRSYRIAADDLAIAGRTALLVTPTGVATLDLDTGCVREAALEVGPAAFDTVHHRIYLATAHSLVRFDTDAMKIGAQIMRPARHLDALAYEPQSDRVVVRTAGTEVRVYDPKLDEVAVFDLPRPPAGGPWPRPGQAEVAFGYTLQCEHRARPAPGDEAPKCADPPSALGARVARIAIPSGDVLGITTYGGASDVFAKPGGSWSGDGKHLLVAQALDAQLYDLDGGWHELHRTGAHPWQGADFSPVFALDATGDRFAGPRADSEIRIGRALTGETTWAADLPRSR